MGRMLQPQQVALVVEDDPDVRELAATVLEETDLKVVEASSAEEALQYLRGHAEEVALLFADVRLPCLMSGVDLAKTVSSESFMYSPSTEINSSSYLFYIHEIPRCR